jgi:hypothetical protein
VFAPLSLSVAPLISEDLGLHTSFWMFSSVLARLDIPTVFIMGLQFSQTKQFRRLYRARARNTSVRCLVERASWRCVFPAATSSNVYQQVEVAEIRKEEVIDANHKPKA